MLFNGKHYKTPIRAASHNSQTDGGLPFYINFLNYFMTYKFYDRTTGNTSAEFFANEEMKFVIIAENMDNDDQVILELNDKDLFNLIGGLLRLQSDMKNFKKEMEALNG